MRNYAKLIRVFEERPNYALGVRAYVSDPEFISALLGAVEDIGSLDPARGLKLARTAVRASRRNGHRCLRSRALEAMVAGHIAFGNLRWAEAYSDYSFSIANGCKCCLPRHHRQRAMLLVMRNENARALTEAETAVTLSLGRLDEGLSVYCRGQIFLHSARFERAAEDYHSAMELLPVQKRAAAIHAYTYALAKAGSMPLILKAASLIPRVEAEFKDIRGISLARAKLEWLKGSVDAAQADFVEDWWECRILWRRGARHLGIAFGRFLRMKKHLPFEIAACATDLAAAEARGDRYKVADVFTPAIPLWPKDLVKLRSAVAHWAKARVPGAAAQMWAALKALRDETVERGCAPPLVPYMDPTAAL